MTKSGVGDYFISDEDEDYLEPDEDIILPSVVVAAEPPAVLPIPEVVPTPVVPEVIPAPAAPVAPVAEAPPVAAAPVAQVQTPPVEVSVKPTSREDRLAEALNNLMLVSPDVEAAALVSMDGFVMASALPAGMQEDRVGAMSAAILGLGERAAAELGRGHLTQVFIEGEDGYVILIAAGERAVLTALTLSKSKLGLVLYDMKTSAEEMAGILG